MNVLRIAQRELDALLRRPVGWMVIALFAVLASAVFAGGLRPGEPATMRGFFGLASVLMILVCPAVSMGLLSDELRSGTAELLRTSPVSDTAVVWGKYLGAVAFVWVMLAATLVLPAVLWVVSEPKPELGPIAAGYLSLALAGGLYLSAGVLASSLTSSQTLAFLGALLPLVGSQLIVQLPAGLAPAWIVELGWWLSVPLRAGAIGGGLIRAADLAFFLALSAALVVAASVALEARRWR